MKSGCIALKRRHTAGDAGYWPTPEKRRIPAEPGQMKRAVRGGTMGGTDRGDDNNLIKGPPKTFGLFFLTRASLPPTLLFM